MYWSSVVALRVCAAAVCVCVGVYESVVFCRRELKEQGEEKKTHFSLTITLSLSLRFPELHLLCRQRPELCGRGTECQAWRSQPDQKTALH